MSAHNDSIRQEKEKTEAKKVIQEYLDKTTVYGGAFFKRDIFFSDNRSIHIHKM